MPLAAGPENLLAAADATAVRERAAAILGRRAYQTELPTEPKNWDVPLDWLDVVMRALFWAAVVVGTVLVLTWMWRRLTSSGRDAAAAVEPAQAADLGARPLAAADALAAEGRFGEAIHALLLLTLDALSQAARLPQSLTSREIVEQVPMPDAARAALGGLVAAVEISWFGGTDPGEDEYRNCLARFHAFLEAYRRAA